MLTGRWCLGRKKEDKSVTIQGVTQIVQGADNVFRPQIATLTAELQGFDGLSRTIEWFYYEMVNVGGQTQVGSSPVYLTFNNNKTKLNINALDVANTPVKSRVYGVKVSWWEGSVHRYVTDRVTVSVVQDGYIPEEELEAIWDSFGTPHLSQTVTNLRQYLSLIELMENKTMGGKGNTYVCDTIQVSFQGSSPYILPDPRVMQGREVSLFVGDTDSVCGPYNRGVYVHKNQLAVGVIGGICVGGTFDTMNTFSTNPGDFEELSGSHISGCTKYYPNSSMDDWSYHITEIACGRNFMLMFRAVKIKGKSYWFLVNQSECSVKLNESQGRRILNATEKVLGFSDWTAKFDAQILKTTKQSNSTFVVTDKMGWIEYNGSSRTATMDFPSSLPEGFMCYLQNNAQTIIIVSGSNPVTSLNRIPARSLCLCRKGSGNNMLIFQISTI